MNPIELLHATSVLGRRYRVLSDHIAGLLPPDSSVLDIGCGDGHIAWQIQQRRSDVRIHGLDVLVRDDTKIPVLPFDGEHVPHDDGSFDVVMFVDVLHHTDDPNTLLREAARVARQRVVIKDHTLDGVGARPVLRFMDWVGNRRYHVRLPYNYWRREQWTRAFEELRWELDVWNDNLKLYRWPLSVVFERSLHFIARLSVGNSDTTLA